MASASSRPSGDSFRETASASLDAGGFEDGLYDVRKQQIRDRAQLKQNSSTSSTS
jgi:hypothetical protein